MLAPSPFVRVSRKPVVTVLQILAGGDLRVVAALEFLQHDFA